MQTNKNHTHSCSTMLFLIHCAIPKSCWTSISGQTLNVFLWQKISKPFHLVFWNAPLTVMDSLPSVCSTWKLLASHCLIGLGSHGPSLLPISGNTLLLLHPQTWSFQTQSEWNHVAKCFMWLSTMISSSISLLKLYIHSHKKNTQGPT